MENKYNRFLDADQEPRQMLQPVEGYNKVALVSLEEAIESILFCCPDVRRRVFIAMSNCENPPDGLSQNESASIYLYTMEWEPKEECVCYVLNATLRSQTRHKLKPWLSYLKLLLTALHKLPSQKAFLWRGVTLDLNSLYEVGKRYVWWGLSSCTRSFAALDSDQFLGRYGPRTVFSIECNNGKIIQSHSHIAIEDEILLLPATQFEVKSKLNPLPDLYIIHLQQIDPPFPLNELVPTTPIIKSKSNGTHNEEELLEVYQNEKLEQQIAECLPNDGIDLCEQKLTDRDLSIVVQRAIIDKKCSSLSIAYNQITNKGAKHLGKILQSNTSLEGLYLEKNQISAKGACWIAKALYTNTSLTHLYLGNNRIDSEGARFLAEALLVNSTLKELWLYNSSIGDRGARFLAQALTRNTMLRYVELQANEITNDGILYLSEMLKRNTTLTHLGLSFNPITDNGIRILMAALCSNQGLEMLAIQCSEMTDKCYTTISSMFTLNTTLNGLWLHPNSFSGHEYDQLRAMSKGRIFTGREWFNRTQGPVSFLDHRQ